MSVKPGIRRERPTFAEVEICKEWWRIPDDGRKPHVLILEIYRDAHYDILGHNGGIFVADEWPGSWAPCLPPTAVSERDSRQAEVFAWARAAFGESGTTIAQRGIRLLEEAIEAYQAAGCSAKMAHELVDFVFGRPVGDIRQELGGVGVCTLVLAAAAGASADDEEAREVQRVLAKSLDAWRERNAEKNAAGFAAAPERATDDIELQRVDEIRDFAAKFRLSDERTARLISSGMSLEDIRTVWFGRAV